MEPDGDSTNGVVVEVDDRQGSHVVDVSGLAALLAATLHDQYEAEFAEVGLTFVESDEMAELNQTFMGGAGPTDVLAFPIDGIEDGVGVPAGQPAMLGNVVICPNVAAQAPQSLEDELALLTVHGALHLVGHDHAEPDETAVMKALETAMLEAHYRNGARRS